MIRRTFTFIILALTLFSTLNLSPHAAPAAQWSEWEAAREFFKNREYAKALAEFQEHPRDSDPYYHYNLGTTYYHLNQLGPALAHLEKANQLSPHQSDILFNLNQTRLLLEKQMSPGLLDPTSTWLDQITDRISLDEVRATLGLIALLITLIWIRSYLKTRSLKNTFFQPSGYIGFIALTLSLLVYSAQRWARSSPPAMVLKAQIVRSGPGDRFMELGNLREGVKIRRLSASAQEEGSQEEWRQIRFSEQAIGWVKSSALLTL